MCGICGIVTNGPPPDLDVATAMIGRLSHRGPDGSGYLRDHQAILGHTRLSLIDFAGGAQPIGNEDGSLWVTFNGEIFNYVELAVELRDRGHRFTTHSDTEVIVHAWEEWGADCFNRFNGQWAIGLWDRRQRQLILSRDRLGVRPLFYRLTDSGITFASEVKAIFADPSVPRAFDPIGLDQILTYWSTVAPRTVFEGVSQLPPGHFAVFDADGFRCEPYWRIDFPARGQEPSQDLQENAEILRELVVRATRLRFERSDFPVGAYLSGGIDSAVTAAAIRHFTDADLDTFSLRFADTEFDEGIYQQRMVEQLGTHHQDIVVTHRDIATVFPDVVWHAEAPILRSAPAPLFLLSKLVRSSGYKVVVTGEGADEVLGGYDIYREAKVRDFWARDPDSTVRSRAAELLYPWMARNPGQAPAFARGFFGQDLDAADPAMSHRPRWKSTSALKTMLTAAVRDAIGTENQQDLANELPEASQRWDPLTRAQWLEMTTLLPGYILASQGDRMLMANSVEGRFPFLDRDVVEFANTLPARHKLFGLDEKFLLKVAFADLIPDEIRDRSKQPYRAPDAASFFTDGSPSDWVEDVVSPAALRASGIFDPKQVGSLVAKARIRSGRFGNTDNMRVLAILSTQLIHRQFIIDPAWVGAQTPPEPVHIIDFVSAERETDDTAHPVRA
ncbi:putative asparagine synthetase [Microlunatus phosphovorus NM-1]|uniref:asparagine synthase (glutamine-hydrolyzing) n=1 Tax=Microlunatus phosphovorus (strain ATCC 700054 / DSM 10555 / JCM 9379 / NBRC 101784 / NCIMB 13414 / VKM Ac-1990 / NM-1) TaxID=1032480 RepID=F5XFW5_MICPN|nr:asparagine synthase (glutamine-hydrolyzing) [Microlunatus phosphovorus]BAK37899.1 putative asparagine synthetase [Microlunatus phosphovorus NM-1]